MFRGFDWRNVWGQHNQLEHVAPQEIYFRILFTPVCWTARCAPCYRAHLNQGIAGWAAASWTCMVEASLPQCYNSWAAETASWFVHFMAVFTLLRWSFISYSHQMFALVILFGCWSLQFSEACSFGGEHWACMRSVGAAGLHHWLALSSSWGCFDFWSLWALNTVACLF